MTETEGQVPLFVVDAICGQYNHQIDEYCQRPPHGKKLVHESEHWLWYGNDGDAWEKVGDEGQEGF